MPPMSALMDRHLIADREMMLARPLTMPERDTRHEWFTKPLPSDSPVVLGWIRHFQTMRVVYNKAAFIGCAYRCTRPHHHVYESTQLYVHRLITPVNVMHRTRWCCDPLSQNGTEARRVS